VSGGMYALGDLELRELHLVGHEALRVVTQSMNEIGNADVRVYLKSTHCHHSLQARVRACVGGKERSGRAENAELAAIDTIDTIAKLPRVNR
jgi:hypothetical protein